MNRWTLLLLLTPTLCVAAVPLEQRLLYPTDLPATCQPTSGLYPLSEKVDLFYQYIVYKSVVPPVTDRHAQSFDCGGTKGTLYYFEYSSTSRSQDALLFAQPVLAQLQPAPVIREWPTGFVVVSFALPPPELLAAIDKKVGSNTSAPTASTSAPATAVPSAQAPAVATTPSPMPIAAAMPTAIQTVPSTTNVPLLAQPSKNMPITATAPPAAQDMPSTASVPTIPQEPMMPGETLPSTPPAAPAAAAAIPTPAVPIPPATALPTLPLAAPPTVVVPTQTVPVTTPLSRPTGTLGPIPDVSDLVLKTLFTRADCKHLDGTDLVKELCSAIEDFRRGAALDALINSPKEPRVGPYCILHFDGSLEGPKYEAMIGSGQLHEVTMVPLFSNTGVDDFEVQDLIDSRKKHKAWPKNEMSTAIAAYALPTHATSQSTTGRSQVLPLREGRYVFFRRAPHSWVYLIVSGTSTAEQLQSDISFGRLY